MAKLGRNTAKVTRNDLENKLGTSIITNNNMLDYKYIENKK